jgi:putative sigma-54 modulation protein
MQLNITGNNLDLTDGLKDHVKDKMSKLEAHFDHVTNAHVILRIEKENQIAEATVHVSGADLFAESTESDMYVAIDHLVGKLDAQIRKHKEKLKDHRR